MPVGRRSLLITVSLGAAFLVYKLAVGQSQPSRDDVAKSLPSTNLSADGTVDRSKLPRPAPGFANARVATNPQVIQAIAAWLSALTPSRSYNVAIDLY